MCWETKVSCNETVGTDLFIFLSLFLVSRTPEDFFFFLLAKRKRESIEHPCAMNWRWGMGLVYSLLCCF